MALRIELEGDKPGIAKLIIQKWQGGADVDILIQRNQDGYYLADDNQWTAETYWHNVPNLTIDDGKLEGVVTNWLVDALLSQENHVRFLITVRDHQQDDHEPSMYLDRGAINIAETVLASSALDTTSRLDSPKMSTAPIVANSENSENSDESTQQPDSEPLSAEVPPPEIPTVIEEEIETPIIVPEKELNPPVKSKSKVGLIVMFLIILLLIAAGLAWYFLFRPKTDEPVAPPPPPQQQVSDCSLSKANDDELTFIKGCLQSKPDTSAILQVINEAKAADKCNIAQRLYANQAQQNADIAITYAKEYDDKFYQTNKCFQIDKDTAAYWYETALSIDPNNTNSALAKERLDELKKQN